MGNGAVSAVFVIVFVLLYAVLLFRSVRKTPPGRWRLPRDWRMPIADLLRWPPVSDRVQPALFRVRLSIAVLEGGVCSTERLLRWAAEAVSMAYAAIAAGWVLALLSGNPLIGWVATFTGGSIPALRARDLHRQVERRKQVLILELPVFMSRLLVLVNAGENVRRALERCLDRLPAGAHPLYDQLHAALAAMQRGESMNLAMEEFGRRCALPEAKMFAAVLLMNLRRGGEAFVPALRDLTRQMWDRRKAAARTLGEQASSRLAFPLALIFLLIIVLVGAPAMFMM